MTVSIWTEEIFGPVLAVRVFSTEEQAVEEANNSAYGLGTVAPGAAARVFAVPWCT